MRNASKLSDAECRVISAARHRGTRVVDLARRYGVSEPTIYAALRRAAAVGTHSPLGVWPARPEQRRPGRHVIDDIRYADEWIRCSCGDEITAPPDELFRDRHEPLVIAWQEHRRGAGVPVLSFAQAMSNHRAYS